MYGKIAQLCVLLLTLLLVACSRTSNISPESDFNDARAVFVAIYQPDLQRWRVEEVFKRSGERSNTLKEGADIEMPGLDDDMRDEPRRLVVVTTGVHWSSDYLPRFELVIKNEKIAVYGITLSEYRAKIKKLRSTDNPDQTP